MRATDLTIQVRGRAADGSGSILDRQGVVLPKDLRLKALVRLNDVGEWSLTLPRLHPMVEILAMPGSGILCDARGQRVFSGPTWRPERVTDKPNPDGTFTFTGYTDDVLLRNARAFPQPSNPDPSTQAVTNDVRTGIAETVMREYVAANIGAAAPSVRRSLAAQHLVLAADELRGPTVSGSPRFQNLLELEQKLATFAGLGFQVIQRGDELVFEVLTLHDRSDTVVLDIRTGSLSSEQAAVSPPLLTRAIVAGQGEGTERVIIQRTSGEASAAEAEWGQIIEEFVDARGTEDLGELEQNGDTRIAEGGFTAIATKVVPSDDQTMLYLADWREGDIVGLIVNGGRRTAVATAAAFIADASRVAVGMSIGDTRQLTERGSTLARVDNTEKRVANIEQADPVPGAVVTDPGTDAVVGWDDGALVALGLGDPLYLDAGSLKIREASDIQRGSVELATDAETITGTDAVRAVTPAGLAARTATDARAGIVELATLAETDTGTDATRAVTPAGLATTRTRLDVLEGQGPIYPPRIPLPLLVTVRARATELYSHEFDPTVPFWIVKTPGGMVQLVGLGSGMSNRAANVPFAQIPPGYRPAIDQRFPGNFNGGRCELTITTAGLVSIDKAITSTGDYIFLSNSPYMEAGASAALTWTPATLQNGWTAVAGATPAYAIDPYGCMLLRGRAAKTGAWTTNQTIFQLPQSISNYQHHMASSTSANLGYLAVGAAGAGSGGGNAVQAKTSASLIASGGDVSFDGMILAPTALDGNFSIFGGSVMTQPLGDLLIRNSWTQFAAQYRQQSIWMRPDRLVICRGLISGGSMNNYMGSAPRGAMPGSRVTLTTVSIDAFARLDVFPKSFINGATDVAGAIVPIQGSGSWFSLDTLCYIAGE